ncbi:MAG: hypothetical protein KQH79_16345 [Bacteroidetes bacterium]|nr:hypothetical protein [Bacteroidota bacterium]
MNRLKMFFIVILLAVISCSEEEDTKSYSVISTTVKIAIVNDQGEDMLDPQIQNHFDENDIKVLHKINGELEVFSEGLLDASRGFKIYKPYELGFNEQYLFCLLATDPSYKTGYLDDYMPIAYIQWNETDMDTLQCQYQETGAILRTVTVWFNGIEKWNYENTYNNDPRLIEIVK